MTPKQIFDHITELTYDFQFTFKDGTFAKFLCKRSFSEFAF